MNPTLFNTLPMATMRKNLAGGERTPASPPDLREALYNDGPVGPAASIQAPAERITRLLGFMWDLDPKLLVPGNPLFPPADDPRQFYRNIRPVLGRHPIARHAQIRISGTGLHAVVPLGPPVELESAADQRRWAVLVRAVQCSLTSDPNAPGITALTRAVGSVNSKNGAVVEVLHEGEPVDPARIVEFVGELAGAPFKAMAAILLGPDEGQACPICRSPGNRLGALDRVGKCYRCGNVTLEALFEAILLPAPLGDPDAAGAGADRTPAKGPSSTPQADCLPTPKAPARKGRRRP